MSNASKRPAVVAHRGASGHMPENTFASFDLAVEMGSDMIELDVHPSLDGELIVMHDDTVDRTTDGHGRVSAMGVKELKALNAAAKFTSPMVEPIPTFAEVLERYSRKVHLMVEVKHGSSIYPGVEKNVVEELKRYDALGRVELNSFDLGCLQNIRRESDAVEVGFIFTGNMASFADLLKGQINALHGRWDFLTRDQVNHAKGLGFSAHVWTVNSEDEIHRAIDTGADGVVSNYPDRVLRAKGRA